jgi:hypothetical protein
MGALLRNRPAVRLPKTNATSDSTSQESFEHSEVVEPDVEPSPEERRVLSSAGSTEPWPVAVDGEELLDSLMAAFQRHLVLQPFTAEACALWTLHTHCFEAFAAPHSSANTFVWESCQSLKRQFCAPRSGFR